MIGTLLKAAAYAKAPRATFTVLHPKNAVLFRKFQWDMRHAHAPRITALGAAALALPVGLWLGRRAIGRNGHEPGASGRAAGMRPEPAGARTAPGDGPSIAEAMGPTGMHSTRGGCVDQTAIGV